MLTRRSLLAFSAALALAPRRARAADLPERKFLFVFARGGWDPTWVFAPGLDPAGIDIDPDTTTATAMGLPYGDAPLRPNVRNFFQKYADRTCIINGMEVRSLTHERCRRILFCGQGEGDADDWAATIAADDPRWRLPHLVLTGPSFTAAHADVVVRLGQNNQLAELLSGKFAQRADVPLDMPGRSATDAAEAFARSRAAEWAAAQPSGQPAKLGGALSSAYDRLDLVRSQASMFDLGTDLGTDPLIPVPDRVTAALQCFEAGYSRCAMIEHLGLFDLTWDSHSANTNQGLHFDLLFADLATILDDLESRPGEGGGSLLDETTVVVISEMGRAPRLNAAGGKDHWTFTSAMLIGAGVRGSTVLGAYDDGLHGHPISLDTGVVDDAGTALTPEHLGATLFALAGLDGAKLVNADPIMAAIE